MYIARNLRPFTVSIRTTWEHVAVHPVFTAIRGGRDRSAFSCEAENIAASELGGAGPERCRGRSDGCAETSWTNTRTTVAVLTKRNSVVISIGQKAQKCQNDH